MPREGRGDELPGETLVPGGIEGKADVRGAIVGGRIVDPAVRVDLQHVRRAVLRDAKIASAETRRLQRDEEAGAFVAKSRREHGVLHGKGLQALVDHPFDVGVLELLALRKLVLGGGVGDRSRGIVRILGHEHRALDPVDVLLDQGGAVTGHDLLRLDSKTRRRPHP